MIKDTQPEKQGHPAAEAGQRAGEAGDRQLSKDTQPEKQDSEQEKRLEIDN
jgi:hypothetical protein